MNFSNFIKKISGKNARNVGSGGINPEETTRQTATGVASVPSGSGTGDSFQNALNLGQKITATDRYDVSVDPTWREAQRVLAGQLQQRATGQTQSAAEIGLASALARNAQQAQAGIRSIGGINPALRQRMVAQQQGRTGAEMAAQGSALRAQEQAGAEKTLAGVLGQAESAALQEQAIKSGAHEAAQKRRQELMKGIGSALSIGGL